MLPCASAAENRMRSRSLEFISHAIVPESVMTPFHERTQYQSDQRIPWSGVPLLLVGTLLVALAVAWVLKSLFFLGWYLIFLVPLFGGLLLGGALYLFVGST